MRIDTLAIPEIWKLIEKEAEAHPEYIEGLDATYAIHLNGDEPGEFSVTFHNGKIQIVEKEVGDADCSLLLSTASFRKLLEGNLNTTAAFMTGKLKVKGNISLALKLEKTLKKFEF